MTTHPSTAGDRIDLIKTALSVGAGTGGVVALVLAGRRQWHNEQAQRDTRHDAEARRITELYTKAADQLGSDKAPVRLAGLYALERVAHDNPSQRQTIVGLVCAYPGCPSIYQAIHQARTPGRPTELDSNSEPRNGKYV